MCYAQDIHEQESWHEEHRKGVQTSPESPKGRKIVQGGYRVSICGAESMGKGRTGHVLLEDIKLLEHSTQKTLRVFINNKDLPSPGRVYGADRVQEL